MSRKNKLKTFGEQYEVNIDYQNPDGYWVHSYDAHINVPVVHGVNEKGNHEAARELVMKLYPKCRVNKVTYC